jgi:nitroreductase
MTSAITAIKQRRAVKYYDPNHKISDNELKNILEIAQQSPSSFNIQHWRFVNVTNPKIREEIKNVAWGQAQITDASVLLVVCTDVKAWQEEPERYWKDASSAVKDALVPMILGFYNGKEQLQRDEAMRSVGLISQTIMIAAKELGYDTCPMIGFDQEKVAEIIKLPKDHAIGMLLVIGKGTKPSHPKGGFLKMNEILFENSF